MVRPGPSTRTRLESRISPWPTRNVPETTRMCASTGCRCGWIQYPAGMRNWNDHSPPLNGSPFVTAISVPGQLGRQSSPTVSTGAAARAASEVAGAPEPVAQAVGRTTIATRRTRFIGKPWAEGLTFERVATISFLPRYPHVTDRRMIRIRRHDDRVLHQVLDRNRVEEVEVGVPAATRHPVLQELESRQARLVERDVIGAADALIRDGRHAHVPERLHPAAQQRPRVLVALKVDAAIGAGAVVLVEVGLKPVVRRLLRGHRVVRIAEVLAHVGARAPEPLLFPAPEGDPDRPSRLRPDRLQDPHRLEHDGDARRVVARVRARVPGIEVRPDHHDLVPEVAAGDLADEVHCLLRARPEPVPYLELHLDRDVALEDPVHPVVVLGCDRDHDGGRTVARGGPAVVPRAGPREAPHRAKPPARALEHRGDAFRLEERGAL